MFRELTPEEEIKFRQWARDNYIPGSKIKLFWHPVVRLECVKMNEELHISSLVRSNVIGFTNH